MSERNSVETEEFFHALDVTEISECPSKDDAIKPGHDAQNVFLVLIQKCLHGGSSTTLSEPHIISRNVNVPFGCGRRPGQASAVNNPR